MISIRELLYTDNQLGLFCVVNKYYCNGKEHHACTYAQIFEQG